VHQIPSSTLYLAGRPNGEHPLRSQDGKAPGWLGVECERLGEGWRSWKKERTKVRDPPHAARSWCRTEEVNEGRLTHEYVVGWVMDGLLQSRHTVHFLSPKS